MKESNILHIPSLDIPSCRICFSSSPLKLITPCGCLGSSKYAHEDCLESWIVGKYQEDSDVVCEICKKKMIIEVKTLWICRISDDRKIKCSYYKNICICVVLISVAATAMSIILHIILQKSNNYILVGVFAAVFSLPLLMCISLLLKNIIGLLVSGSKKTIKIKTRYHKSDFNSSEITLYSNNT